MRTILLSLSALGFAANVDKNRPVTKVINLLKEIQTTLEKEGKADKEVYDKFACWCTTNEKEKTQSIKTAEEAINQLTANIEEYTATVARLKTEIKNLEKEVDENQKALDTATAIRRKEVGEMNEEEKDLIKSIRALKSAIVALSKHHESMIQEGSLKDIASLLDQQIKQHGDKLSGVLTQSQKSLVHSFLQAPGGFKSHSSQSGQIFGILESMRDTFEANLSTSQREELENQRIYEQLKAAKTEEIQAGQEQIDKKNEQMASTREANAEAKQNLEDTQNSLAADQAFLADLKMRCGQTDAQWEQRQAARLEEVQAVGEALKILSGGDAHDTFTSTFNNFLQKGTDRSEASKILSAAATKFHNPKLSNLATAVRLDAFTKVKKAIDDMIGQLTREKDDEIKHKDWCNESLHQNLSFNEKTQRNIDEHNAAIDGLEADIKTLTGEIDVLKAEVKELHVQIKRAGENRAIANKEFQETVADQKEAQAVLGKAIGVLKAVFERKEKARFAALVQEDPVGPPPPAGFKEYKKNSGAGDVISLVQQIMNDAKNMEAETIRDEEDAQAGYESFVKESNSSINTKNKSIVNKTEIRATKQGEKTEHDTVLSTEEDQLKTLKSEEADLHKSCDFVLKNFDIRQEARDQEVEALRQAKSILSGSGVTGFLQRS